MPASEASAADGGRAQQTLEPRPSRRLGHREHAADRSQPPVEPELADRRMSS